MEERPQGVTGWVRGDEETGENIKDVITKLPGNPSTRGLLRLPRNGENIALVSGFCTDQGRNRREMILFLRFCKGRDKHCQAILTSVTLGKLQKEP